MDIIHADASLAEIGFINDVGDYDGEISQELDAEIHKNSFSLSISELAWEASSIERGHYVYIPGTEFGGCVEQIKHSTIRGLVTVSGATWRGMLHRKIIEPSSGDDYFTVTATEANAAIASIVGGSLGPLFTVSAASSGITITSKQFRYQRLLQGLEDMLEEEGAALQITFNQATKQVMLSARAVVDYSSTIDLSQDYNADMVTTEGGFDRYNHVIALGSGELAGRDIIHVYRLSTGAVTTSPPAWAGTEEDWVTTYEYTNPETLAILQQGAEKRVREYTPLKQVEIDPSVAGLDLQLGDIVGARDRLTGMSGTAVVVGKILTINAGGIKLETRVK